MTQKLTSPIIHTKQRISILKLKPDEIKGELRADEIKGELRAAQQEILNIVDIWVSLGSGWSIYLNLTTYRPLRGGRYIPLPAKLQNSKKGLINIKNLKDDKCFLWCHIHHKNPQEKDPQRIKKTDKQYIEKLNHKDITFPVSQKYYNKIEKQNNIRINIFGYEENNHTRFTFPKKRLKVK